MKKQIHILILVVFIFFLHGCSSISTQHGDGLVAEKGVITLHSDDLSNQQLVSLEGEWSFYWHQLLTSDKIVQAKQQKEPDYIELPSPWESKTGTNAGYATYSLTLHIPNELQGQVMGIYIPHQYSSYYLFADEVMIAANGKVGIDEESSQPAFIKELAYFQPSHSTITLTMQVSNFVHPIGGASRQILFGTDTAISTYYDGVVAATLFVIGGILVMGIYQISIFIFRREEKAFLYFGIMSILIAARALFVEPVFITAMFPNFSWIWQHRLEFFIMYLAYMMYFLFLKSLYPNEISKRVVRGLIALSLILVGITVFTQPLLYRPLFNYFLCIAFVSLLYVFFVLITAIRHKRPTAVINLTASILFFLTVINDALLSLDWIDGKFYATYGFFLYIFIQSVNLSRNYAKKFQESEVLTGELRELNLSLDQKVQARTEQLEVMNEKLRELTFLDGLTGLYNRRFFDEKMMETVAESEKANEPLTLLIIDLDEFKKYNDTYGHVNGDQLIKISAAIFKEVVGQSGYVARYGGEEFAVILPNCKQEKGYAIAEEIRESMEGAKIEHRTNIPSGFATLSVGGTSSSEHAFKEMEDWIRFADRALYVSKENGKNSSTMM